MKKHDDLRTPKWVWKPLGPFDLDPCAGENTNIGALNYKLENGDDGLELPWKGFVWCNPPFSQKDLWIVKMLDHGRGILILPERGSAPWFGPLAEQCTAHFVMGKKINFEGGPSSNNLGSVLFLFGAETVGRVASSGLPGHLNKTEFYKSRI